MERQAMKELFKMTKKKKNLLLIPMLWPDWKGSKLPASKSPIKRIKSTYDVGSIQPFWPGQCTDNNEELMKNFQLGRLWRYFETYRFWYHIMWHRIQISLFLTLYVIFSLWEKSIIFVRCLSENKNVCSFVEVVFIFVSIYMFDASVYFNSKTSLKTQPLC